MPCAPFTTKRVSGRGGDQEDRFVRLRTALLKVQYVLVVHPALAQVPGLSCGERELVVVLADHEEEADLLKIVAGLMTRASELPEDGFRTACHELRVLLGGSVEVGDSLKLNRGYHVVLFHGLRIEKEIPIAEDMRILPFENVREHVDEGLLRAFAPNMAVPKAWESVGAIVKPFEWKPEFRSWDPDIILDLDWGGSFRDDGERLVELLATTHGTPVVCLMTIHYCIDRAACCLLGQLHYHASSTLGLSARSFDRMAVSREPSMAALDEARALFRERNGARFRKYEPIIARLAEAVSRSGRFALDDRILDVAIALERLYELDQGEIVFKLRTRAACFLETETLGRSQVFEDVGKFYEARSAIVHSSKKKQWSAEKREAAFRKGLDIARRSVGKLLLEGSPADWNEVVIAARGSIWLNPGSGAGTTEPGYRNRNGQVVIRKTDIPSNDHNQVVYELECGGCGHQYGVNGSDIWVRKCPKCDGGMPGLSF